MIAETVLRASSDVKEKSELWPIPLRAVAEMPTRITGHLEQGFTRAVMAMAEAIRVGRLSLRVLRIRGGYFRQLGRRGRWRHS